MTNNTGIYRPFSHGELQFLADALAVANAFETPRRLPLDLVHFMLSSYSQNISDAIFRMVMASFMRARNSEEVAFYPYVIFRDVGGQMPAPRPGIGDALRLGWSLVFPGFRNPISHAELRSLWGEGFEATEQAESLRLQHEVLSVLGSTGQLVCQHRKKALPALERIEEKAEFKGHLATYNPENRRHYIPVTVWITPRKSA